MMISMTIMLGNELETVPDYFLSKTEQEERLILINAYSSICVMSYQYF